MQTNGYARRKLCQGVFGQEFDSPRLHQINIIRTLDQSVKGSDLLFISQKLKIGKHKNGRITEYGNPPVVFM
mgnify:CR=1 FL=1